MFFLNLQCCPSVSQYAQQFMDPIEGLGTAYVQWLTAKRF